MFKNITNYIKWLFRKPEISFNKKLTSDDIVKMFKEKKFYELREILPMIGGMNRKKSLIFLFTCLVVGSIASVLSSNPLPLLFTFIGGITYGSEVVPVAYAATDFDLCTITSTKFCVVWKGTSNYGYAIIGDIDETVITFGTQQTFASAATYEVFVVGMDSTHVLMAYRDGGNSDKGTAIAASISGTVMTFGSEAIFYNSSTVVNSLISVSSSKAFVSSNTGFGSVWTLNLSGTTVSGGAGNVFYNGTCNRIRLAKLTSSTFAVFYRTAAGANYVIIGNGSTYGDTSTVVDNVNLNYVDMCDLDSTHFAIIYHDGSASGAGKAIIGVVTGTSVAFGSIVTFNAGSTTDPHVARLSDDRFIVTYEDAGNSNAGTCIMGTVTSGDEIAFGSEYTYNSGSSTFIPMVASFSEYSAVVLFKDNVNSEVLTTIFAAVNALTSPGNAYADDASYATGTTTDGDIVVSLSKDNGVTYNTELTKTFAASETSETYGDGSTELWGTTWTGDYVGNSYFKLKVQCGNAEANQVFGEFGFSIANSNTLTGIEVVIKAKYVSTTLSINHIKVKAYYGTSVLPIQAGSQVYASDGRKAGEGAGAGTGVLVFYDGTNWIASDTGATVAA